MFDDRSVARATCTRYVPAATSGNVGVNARTVLLNRKSVRPAIAPCGPDTTIGMPANFDGSIGSENVSRIVVATVTPGVFGAGLMSTYEGGVKSIEVKVDTKSSVITLPTRSFTFLTRMVYRVDSFNGFTGVKVTATSPVSM